MKPIITRILVPTDFSETSDKALEYARLLATRFGASLCLLHVLNDPHIGEGPRSNSALAGSQSMRAAALADAHARLAERARGATATDVVLGDCAMAIVEYAASSGSDLIVIGTHGRTGVAHLLLGSVTERVVQTAPCPVLTVGHVAAAARASIAMAGAAVVAAAVAT